MSFSRKLLIALLVAAVLALPVIAKQAGAGKERAKTDKAHAKTDKEAKTKAAKAENLAQEKTQKALAGHSADPEKEAELFLRHFDKNKDGVVTKDEFKGGDSRWKQLDTDQNGKIDKAEYSKSAQSRQEAYQQKMLATRSQSRAPWFTDALKKSDADQNQQLNLDEFRTGMEDIFKSLDINQDGQLDSAEMALRAMPERQPSRPDPGQQAAQLIKRYDKNDDDKVAADEWRGPKERFQQMDGNADNVIDLQEMTQYVSKLDSRTAERTRPDPRESYAERLKKMDGNADGKITRDEYKGPEQLFDRFDGNQDGELSTEEVDGALKKMAQPDNRPPQFNVQTFVKRFDSDGDGSIMKEEFKTGNGPDALFIQIDQDKDGLLTQQELAAYQTKLQGQSHPKEQ